MRLNKEIGYIVVSKVHILRLLTMKDVLVTMRGSAASIPTRILVSGVLAVNSMLTWAIGMPSSSVQEVKYV